MNRAKLCTVATLALALGASLAAGCTSGNGTTAAVFHATWTVAPGNCASHNAQKISFAFTDSANGLHDEIFDCSDGANNTAPLPLSSYTYVVALLHCPDTTPGCPGSSTVLMAPALSVNTDTCDTITGTTCNIDLPTIDFSFTP